jgi:hypothetical protein
VSTPEGNSEGTLDEWRSQGVFRSAQYRLSENETAYVFTGAPSATVIRHKSATSGAQLHGFSACSFFAWGLHLAVCPAPDQLHSSRYRCRSRRGGKSGWSRDDVFEYLYAAIRNERVIVRAEDRNRADTVVRIVSATQISGDVVVELVKHWPIAASVQVSDGCRPIFASTPVRRIDRDKVDGAACG